MWTTTSLRLYKVGAVKLQRGLVLIRVLNTLVRGKEEGGERETDTKRVPKGKP